MLRVREAPGQNLAGAVAGTVHRAGDRALSLYKKHDWMYIIYLFADWCRSGLPLGPTAAAPVRLAGRHRATVRWSGRPPRAERSLAGLHPC